MMMLMVQNDGHSSAIKDYDEVIRIDPTLAKAYNNRGYCHQNLNNHEQGTGTCYEWYRGECHWHRWRIVTDVVQLATSIHPSSAIKDFNRALELVSDINRTERIDALYNRAFSYSRLNKHEQGAVHCAFPHSSRRLALTRSRALCSLTQSAIADHSELLSVNPTDVYALRCRGFALQRLNRHVEAMRDFEQAIALEPADSNPYVNMGFSMRILEKHESGTRVHVAYSTAYASSHSLGCWLRWCLEAIIEFTRAIAIDNKDANTFTNRGLSYLGLDRLNEAEADFDQALRLDRTFGAALLGQAIVRVRRGLLPCEKDLLRALELITDSVKRLPFSPWWRFYRGQAHRYFALTMTLPSRREEHLQRALEDLSYSLSLDHDYTGAMAERACVYLELGRVAAAKSEMEHALRLCPASTIASLVFVCTQLLLCRLVLDTSDIWRSPSQRPRRHGDCSSRFDSDCNDNRATRRCHHRRHHRSPMSMPWRRWSFVELQILQKTLRLPNNHPPPRQQCDLGARDAS